jgi:hypothetical protein
MKERRKQIMKRLIYEELENREMLAGPPVIAMASTGLTNNSYEDFYKAQVGTEIGGPAGVGMVDDAAAPVVSTFRAAAQNTVNIVSPFAENATGVGQMVITTGANTPGIGSFALPIAGPSRAGGTGSVTMGLPAAGLAKSYDADIDAAIEALFAEPEDSQVAADDESSPSGAKVSKRDEPSIKTGRRSFDIEGDKAESSEQQTPQAQPAK